MVRRQYKKIPNLAKSIVGEGYILPRPDKTGVLFDEEY